MVTLFPSGYGTARVTLQEMQNRHLYRMEPEYARRLFAWLDSQGGKFGIGGGWRPNPSDISAASREGKSFHQTQLFMDGFAGYCAVDLVVYTNGGLHRAPTRDEAIWQGSEESKRIGLHMNIDSETWHMQPIEIDGWLGWSLGKRKRPVPGYPIPSSVPINPPAIPGGIPPFAPEQGVFSLWPLNTAKPQLGVFMPGQPMDAIRYLQGVLKVRAKFVIDVDGYFGGRTYDCVRWFQGMNGLTVDGIVGPKTWAAIDKLALQ